jgi:RNA polymerase sigma factor (sigma-70 family)
MKTMLDVPQEDADLVADCLEGSRDAFQILVERYQSLIAALIYSRCGNLAQSEDLAQETFLAAWKSLASLQDGAHFKAWLCQIARNVSANVARQDDRKPHGHASSMDSIPELADDKPSPVTEAMSREEEEVVWQTLARLPENYRLPLILFHREGESVAAVAAALDLSEEVTRQRLARGREILKREVNNVVEGALQRTRPGAKFTATTIAGIGAASVSTAKAAGMGTAAAGSVAVTKTFLAAGIFWAGVVPIIGEWVAWWLVRRKTRNAEERSIFKRFAIYGTLTTLVFSVWTTALGQWTNHYKGPRGIALLVASSVLFCGIRWGKAFMALRKAGWLGEVVKSSDGRSHRKGYAPGWQVRCPKCGLTVDAGAAGLIRVGAAGTTRRLGPCSVCRRFRWLIVERSGK